MNIRISFALLTLLLAFNAHAQSPAALACLQYHDPVLRNADGSLSPNPAFDTCLKAPISERARARRAAPVVPATTKPLLPASGTPVAAALAPGGAASPVPASSTPAVQPAMPAPLPDPELATAASPPAPVEPPPLPKPVWSAKGGDDTIRSTVERWADRVGWAVVWDATNFYVDTDFKAEGNFLDAVETFLSRFRLAETPPIGCAYTKPAKPILVITRNSECNSVSP